MARKKSYTSQDYFGRVFGWSITMILISGILVMIAVSREDQDPRYRGRPDPQGKAFKKALIIEAPIVPLIIFFVWYFYHRKDKKARQREQRY